MDSFDSYPELAAFIRTVAGGSGVRHFVIHARKCLLKGLNPAQNRSVPPLRYEWVWALKRDFPHLDFSLNGGVLTLEETAAALRVVNAPTPDSSDAAAAAAAAEGGEAAAEGGATATGGETAAAPAAPPPLPLGDVPPGSSAGVSGRQGIWGVMVGRAAYNMPWDTLGALGGCGWMLWRV